MDLIFSVNARHVSSEYRHFVKFKESMSQRFIGALAKDPRCILYTHSSTQIRKETFSIDQVIKGERELL